MRATRWPCYPPPMRRRARKDIFAVGVIAYKLLTGRFPFDSRMFDDEARRASVLLGSAASTLLTLSDLRVLRFHGRRSTLVTQAPTAARQLQHVGASSAVAHLIRRPSSQRREASTIA